MKVVIDIECNSLDNPEHIWVIVCKDIETGELHVWRKPTEDARSKDNFLEFASRVDLWVGHNWLEYDYPVLNACLGLTVPEVEDRSVDTLVVSRLVNYARFGSYHQAEQTAAVAVNYKGHSIESYGIEFGLSKIKYDDFTQLTPKMEEYCARDVEICHRIYDRFASIINDPKWRSAIQLEHRFQYLAVNALHRNGFGFNRDKADRLMARVSKDLASLDGQILTQFPPREVLIREFTPKTTKFGTISKTSVPRSLWNEIQNYEAGQTYRHTKQEPFNPSSHKQIIEVLSKSGWSPTDKTKTHIETEREINRLKYSKSKGTELDIDIQNLYIKLDHLGKYGFKINETNLATLPNDAPAPARTLAKRILLEARRRTLTEWLSLVQPDGRIHGRFYGIGAWTGRMAHQQPNTANIPREGKLFGHEMRSLWQAPKKRLLVGVDAEGIQLRIFAHYIDDPEFTESLVNGKKSDKTDPHSFNAGILGTTRDKAKQFIYAYLLGAGSGKLAAILGCDKQGAEAALGRLLERYSGLDFLRSTVIPRDAKRGYFEGLDGRRVPIPGDTIGERRHLCMSGYLQSGEAVVMKKATVRWIKEIESETSLVKTLQKTVRNSEIKIVNLVHDEWQTETPNDMEIALRVAELQSRSLREVGEELGLKCPLAGSCWNDVKQDYTIGTNWSVTH